MPFVGDPAAVLVMRVQQMVGFAPADFAQDASGSTP